MGGLREKVLASMEPGAGILGPNYNPKPGARKFIPPGGLGAYKPKKDSLGKIIERVWNILFKGAPLGYDENTWKPK